MKISEVITRLQAGLAKYGDVEDHGLPSDVFGEDVPIEAEHTVHHARLDKMYDMLPCYRGKPKLTFNRDPDGPGQYCWAKHQINLDLQTEQDMRAFPLFSKDEFWLFSLAHEYAHAYMPTTLRENLALREKGPAYIRHEKETDNMAAVIILSLVGEYGFPERDRAKQRIAGWNGAREQHFLAVLHQWSARMRKEYCPEPLPE